MDAHYEGDLAAGSKQQAALLRAGHWRCFDIDNIAAEIEDVGKREMHELASRLTVLIAHLLKWKYQPARRSASWRRTMRVQRQRIDRRLARMPSVYRCLHDAEWMDDVWEEAVVQASMEDLPEACPWTLRDMRSHDFLPG